MIGLATSPIRGLVHWLFGLALLGTLWVTAITSLSARPTATAVLTDLGAQVLNPYLVKGTDGLFGVSQTNYPILEQEAQAHPDQALTLPGLKVQVLGSEIVGHSYADGVRVIYGHVADAYYDGGASAVFALPQQYTQLIDNYGVFALPSGTTLPGGSSTSGTGSTGSQGSSSPSLPQIPQVPSFLQPIFNSLGLSPSTLTAAGHARIASTLTWWWSAAIILGLLAIVFNAGASRVRPAKQPSALAQRALGSLGPLTGPVEAIFKALTGGARRISSVGWAIFHAGWPGIAIPGLMWLLSVYVFPTQLKPYTNILAVITQVFVPVYGAGIVVGLIVVLIPWLALGVLLLLGALAGALAIFGLRPKPAAQPYVPSIPATTPAPGRAPAGQYGQQNSYQQQYPPASGGAQYGASRQAHHQPSPSYQRPADGQYEPDPIYQPHPSAQQPGGQYGQYPQSQGYQGPSRYQPAVPQQYGQYGQYDQQAPAGQGGYPGDGSGGYSGYGGDDPSGGYPPPQRGGGMSPAGPGAAGRYRIPNRGNYPDGQPQPGRTPPGYGQQSPGAPYGADDYDDGYNRPNRG